MNDFPRRPASGPLRGGQGTNNFPRRPASEPLRSGQSTNDFPRRPASAPLRGGQGINDFPRLPTSEPLRGGQGINDFSPRSTSEPLRDGQDMNDFLPRSTSEPLRDGQMPGYLTVKSQDLTVFRWWYRLASPVMPDDAVPFREREHFLRGRTGSQILPALYLFLLLSLPTGFLGINPSVFMIVGIGFAAIIIATICNRMGLVNLAGFIVVATFVANPIATIVTTPGGLNMMVLPLYGLLVLPLVCAVSFLPPWWVFIVALGDCAFTWFSLVYLPQTAELNALLSINFAGIVTPIILSQLIVAVVAFLWVRSTVKALMRADRAEELARLEHDLALQAESTAQRKQQLEVSIQQIVETHRRVANGDYNVRVPLTSDNVLWPISGSLNNLLARVQSWRQDLAQLQQVKFALQQAREENKRLTKMLRN